MKYQQPSFTVAVTDRHAPKPDSFAALMERTHHERRRARARLPHEYEGGTICQLCGLDKLARIHEGPQQ